MFVYFDEEINYYLYERPVCNYYAVIDEKCKNNILIERIVEKHEDDRIYIEKERYSNYEFVYNVRKATGKKKLNYIIVKDPSFRIGEKKIGIGSTRRQVNSVYRIKSMIEVSDPKHQIGFEDHDAWVEFQLDDKGIVNSFRIITKPFQ